MEMPNKNGGLDIVNNIVRPIDTHVHTWNCDEIIICSAIFNRWGDDLRGSLTLKRFLSNVISCWARVVDGGTTSNPHY